MFLPGLLFALATFLPLQSPILIVIDFGLVNFFCGAASAGFYKCAALYGRYTYVQYLNTLHSSRQYGQFILAMFQLLKSITLFLGPALFALLVQDEHSQSEWSRIFWLFALTMITVSAPNSQPQGFKHVLSSQISCFSNSQQTNQLLIPPPPSSTTRLNYKNL